MLFSHENLNILGRRSSYSRVLIIDLLFRVGSSILETSTPSFHTQAERATRRSLMGGWAGFRGSGLWWPGQWLRLMRTRTSLEATSSREEDSREATSSREVDSREADSREATSSREVFIREVYSRQLDIREVDSRQLASREVYSRQLASRDWA